MIGVPANAIPYRSRVVKPHLIQLFIAIMNGSAFVLLEEPAMNTARDAATHTTRKPATHQQATPQPAWHAMSTREVAERLQSSATGLSPDVAGERQVQYGANELQAGQKVAAWRILADQFKNVLLLILIIATALSIVTGHGTESIIIAIIVIFAVGLGFFQEYRAERAMEALNQMAAPTATVIRGSEEMQLPARELVPGDVILLKAGDKVPADCRLFEVHNLQAEEAALTGESLPSVKQVEPLDDPELSAGDRTNMLFAGTAVTYGRGQAMVVAIGMSTEFGKIATMLQGIQQSRTPLQENLDRVAEPWRSSR